VAYCSWKALGNHPVALRAETYQRLVSISKEGDTDGVYGAARQLRTVALNSEGSASAN
jgi:hypothetical protein